MFMTLGNDFCSEIWILFTRNSTLWYTTKYAFIYLFKYFRSRFFLQIIWYFHLSLRQHNRATVSVQPKSLLFNTSFCFIKHLSDISVKRLSRCLTGSDQSTALTNHLRRHIPSARKAVHRLNRLKACPHWSTIKFASCIKATMGILKMLSHTAVESLQRV